MPQKIPDIPKLKQSLESEDASVRFNAGLDLVKAGDPAGVPALIEAFEHSSSVLRTFHASTALVKLGKPAIPDLLKALDAPGIQTRVDAAVTLAQIDSVYLEQVFPIVEEGLRSDHAEASYDAIQFIGLYAREYAGKVVPFLLDVLQTPVEVCDPQAWLEHKRVLVSGLLCVLGEPAKTIVHVLITNLKDEQPGVRWSAAVCLGTMKKKASEAIPALLEMATNETEVETVRVEAIHALAIMAPPVRVTLPVLIQLLDSGDAWIRTFAARILGEMGSPSGKKRSGTKMRWIIRAFFAPRNEMRLRNPAHAVKALIPLLDDPVYDVRRNTAYALSLIGEKAREAVPALIMGLAREDTGAVYAEALAKIGGGVRAQLEEAFPRLDAVGQRHAGYALQKLGVEVDTSSVKFEPKPHHFYVHFNVTLTEEKCQAFEALYMQSLGKEVLYDLPYPKVEFMRFLVEKKGLYMHGTHLMDLEVLKPLRTSIDGADSGNVSGVYADLGYIRPIYFAVVDRVRSFGLSNGFFDLDEEGKDVEGERGFDHRYYKLAIGVNGMMRDPWRKGMVYALPPDTFEYWNEWTSRVPVKPLLRIPVSREDLPVEVWGCDWRQAGNVFVQLDDPFPFLSDTKYTPIRLSGKAPWMR